MSHTGLYPHTRLRRNRKSQWSRDLVAENHVHASDLIWPVFVCEDTESRIVPSFPDVVRYSLDELVSAIAHAVSLGIRAVALFPVTPHHLKCAHGRESQNTENLICRATRLVKDNFPDVGVITDVALDPYTDHGHDGVLCSKGDVANDETIKILIEGALNQARAGADVLSPSDMMDGRVGAIRQALDAHDFHHVQILSYAAKYASAFYGPFRDAVDSSSCLGKGGKKTYQMDFANSDEAMRECAQDIQEGTDMLMVKPGLPYLDILWRVKSTFHLPTFVYHVSGEYSMLKAASQNGWLDYDKAIIEVMMAFKRAGANGIFTYAACEIAEILLRSPNRAQKAA